MNAAALGAGQCANDKTARDNLRNLINDDIVDETLQNIFLETIIMAFTDARIRLAAIISQAGRQAGRQAGILTF
jgi:hypothetical protein